MERVISREDENMNLPPGFRFHPTDEELITHYLCPKVVDNNFCAIAIGEVDLNKVEPWDLPWRAKMGEKEWYFFCVRDRKYPTGMRTNRATEAGYWKATGKDKEIFKVKALVGMKKTLVFYKGRAPKGVKTNWVIHEYRLEGQNSIHNLSKVAKSEWVICRIFKKNSGGKKIHISSLMKKNNYDDLGTSKLPPLMDFPSKEVQTRTSRVTCFSINEMEDQKPQMAAAAASSSNFSTIFPKVSTPNSVLSNQIMPYYIENLQFGDSFFMQDPHSITRILMEENIGQNMKHINVEFSEDISSSMSNHHDWRPTGYVGGQEFPITVAGPVDLDCLWNY